MIWGKRVSKIANWRACSASAMRFYLLGERNSGTNLLEFCLKTMLSPKFLPPGGPARLPFPDPIGGFHSKHLFFDEHFEGAVCSDDVYLHVYRNPCDWSYAMFRRQTDGAPMRDAADFGSFLKTPWLDSVSNRSSASIAELYARKADAYVRFLSTCKHAHSIRFEDLVMNPGRLLNDILKLHNVTAGRRSCVARRVAPYAMSAELKQKIESSSNASCAACCMRVENWQGNAKQHTSPFAAL